jgi:hypothetical protein
MGEGEKRMIKTWEEQLSETVTATLECRVRLEGKHAITRREATPEDIRRAGFVECDAAEVARLTAQLDGERAVTERYLAERNLAREGEQEYQVLLDKVRSALGASAGEDIVEAAHRARKGVAK